MAEIPAQEEPAGGNDGTGSGTATGLSCKEIYDAVSVCGSTYERCAAPRTEQACADGCYATLTTCIDGAVAQGSDLGQAQFDAIVACEETHFNTCYEEADGVFNSCAGLCRCGLPKQLRKPGQRNLAVLHEFRVFGILRSLRRQPGPGGPRRLGYREWNRWRLGLGRRRFRLGWRGGGRSSGRPACLWRTVRVRGQLQRESVLWPGVLRCGIGPGEDAMECPDHLRESACNGNVSSAEQYKLCLQNDCTDLYNTCFGTSSFPVRREGAVEQPRDSGTCGSGYGCIQDCYSTAFDELDFFGCVEICYAQMSPASVAVMDNLTACTDVQCAGGGGSLEDYFQCPANPMSHAIRCLHE